MEKEKMIIKILHIVLRPLFGICLFLSQFISTRNTFFTDNYYFIITGILLIISAVLILTGASSHLKKAVNEKKIANTGPYKHIRHPIYTSVYIMSIGLGLMFFAWSWFIVMIVFIPLWYKESKEEERKMINLFKQEYIDYKKKTGMFLPGILK